MNNQWKQVALSEITSVSAGNSAPQDPSYFAKGTIPFFRTSDAGRVKFGAIYDSVDKLNAHGASNLRRYPAGTILFPKSGASTFLNHRVVLGVEGCVSSHLATIVPNLSHVLPQFLLYALTLIDAKDLIQDQSYPSLNLPAIEKIRIHLPPLAEQQRIVRLLDEAFQGIAVVKANAEKNLQNAHALLASHLRSVFATDQVGWSVETIDTACNVEYGTRVVQKRDGGQGYSVYGGGGATFEVDRFNREDRLVIARFGMSAACTRLVAGRFFLNDSGLTVSPKNSKNKQRFFEYQLLALNDAIYALGSGTAQKNLDVPAFRAMTVQFPASMEEQNKIVAQISALVESTDRLSAICVHRLAAVDELRKSLLRQVLVSQKQAA